MKEINKLRRKCNDNKLDLSEDAYGIKNKRVNYIQARRSLCKYKMDF